MTLKEQDAVAPSARNRQIESEEIEGAREAVAEGKPLPRDPRSAALVILTGLAVMYTLYFARELFLPVILAIMLKLLLQPVMRVLTTRLRLPQLLAALLVILAVFGAIAAAGLSLSVPASAWMQKAPQVLPLLREKIAILREPVEALQNALKEVDRVAAPAGQDPGAQTVMVKQGGGVAGVLFTGTAALLTGFFTTMVLLFFLLGSGDRLLRGFVEILPRFSEKRQTVEIATEIEENIAGYLLTITMMNAAVGIAAGFAAWLCGLGDPVLWGVMAFLLNYVPILGPLTGVVVFFLVGLMTYSSPWYALIPAGVYLLIHIAEGETITPMLLARRFTLNPTLVIVSLFFWHMIWGVPGAFLAVPILAMIKIVCDRVEPLMPVGHIIGS